ncbi:MAG: polyprenyl synthetase family protein [Desulfovibrionaceae bacterium]|nr:polyprenyl synthetase family protein [Desulfovibrionaceae bacterium]
MRVFKKILNAEDKKILAALREEIAALEPAARPLAGHILEAGGKRIRPLLTVLTARSFGCHDPIIYALAGGIEFLHGATLLHDDVVDGAGIRRGSPSAHTVFGASRAILAGDVLLAACMRIMLRSRKFGILESVSLAASKTAAGEVEEINNLRNPGLDYAGYLEIITNKTAWLIRCACEIGAMQAEASPEQIDAAAGFGLELGIAFQLVDDALDIAPEGLTGKPSGGDLREGKITPLLHFYLETMPPGEQTAFLHAFTQAAFKEEDLSAILGRMRACGCAERLRGIAGAHLTKAEAFLASFPPGEEHDALLDLLGYIKDREH